MLGIYLERYRGLSPLYKLNQGYSFVADREGNGITIHKTGTVRRSVGDFCDRRCDRGRSCEAAGRKTGINDRTDSENRYTEQRNRRGLSGTGHSLLQKLESSDTSLEDSFRLYKKGMELLKYCSGRLDTVEKKMLQMDEDGTLREF